MQPVEIYTKSTCGFCLAAKRLLAQRGVSFSEIDILRAPARRAEMIERAGGRTTVPQVFVGDTHVGGYDELAALAHSGRLDAMLAD